MQILSDSVLNAQPRCVGCFWSFPNGRGGTRFTALMRSRTHDLRPERSSDHCCHHPLRLCFAPVVVVFTATISSQILDERWMGLVSLFGYHASFAQRCSFGKKRCTKPNCAESCRQQRREVGVTDPMLRCGATVDSFGPPQHFGGAGGPSARTAYRAGCSLCATGFRLAARAVGSKPRPAIRNHSPNPRAAINSSTRIAGSPKSKRTGSPAIFQTNQTGDNFTCDSQTHSQEPGYPLRVPFRREGAALPHVARRRQAHSGSYFDSLCLLFWRP